MGWAAVLGAALVVVYAALREIVAEAIAKP